MLKTILYAAAVPFLPSLIRCAPAANDLTSYYVQSHVQRGLNFQTIILRNPLEAEDWDDPSNTKYWTMDYK